MFEDILNDIQAYFKEKGRTKTRSYIIKKSLILLMDLTVRSGVFQQFFHKKYFGKLFNNKKDYFYKGSFSRYHCSYRGLCIYGKSDQKKYFSLQKIKVSNYFKQSIQNVYLLIHINKAKSKIYKYHKQRIASFLTNFEFIFNGTKMVGK